MSRGRFLHIILLSSMFRVFLLLVPIVLAASLAVTATNFAAENGSYLPVSNKILVTDKGFSKSSSTQTASGTACGSPVTFSGTAGIANTPITSSDIMFDAQSNTTSSTPVSTCFKVTLIVSTSVTSSSTFGPVYVSTGSTVTAGQTIDCKFDVGTSLPGSPFSFKVTVQ